MDTRLFETYDEMCRLIADEIAADLAQNPEQLLCIAAGHTSLGVFKYLIEDFNAGKIDFSQAAFVAMDEWLHMSDKTTESCGYFIRKNFLEYVNYKPENVRLWDGTVSDTEKECRAVEAFIQEKSLHGSIDYLVLGSGMNGHLALNEPGTSFASTAHTSVLDTVTSQVGQKYFTDGASLTGGITLGIENFRQSGRTVLAINGARKAEILKKLLGSTAPDEQLPVTALLTFENASLYYDRESLGE